jgi:hypothetical protein
LQQTSALTFTSAADLSPVFLNHVQLSPFPGLHAELALLAAFLLVSNRSVHLHFCCCSSFFLNHCVQLAPELHAELGSSSLLVFKGDLNYRWAVVALLWVTVGCCLVRGLLSMTVSRVF